MNNQNESFSLKIISYFVGLIIAGFSFLFILPILISLIFKEWDVSLDFTLAFSISIIIGLFLIDYGIETKEKSFHVSWKHGLVVASLSWVLLTLLGAIPYYLSGQMLSFIDAVFDVMSGYTTTGVFLIQDLDHVSNGLNFWRHLITFVGGQGMVVLALSFFINEMSGAYKFYVGEGKDVSLVPNVQGTAQIIWRISIVYLILGTLIFWLVGMSIGLSPVSAFMHGLFIFEAAWSTGGFAPNYQNLMFYHSFFYETITIVFFIIGSFNFGLHYAFIKKDRKEFFRNLEILSFFITSFIATAILLAYFSKGELFSTPISLFRRVVYNVLSAHTTTGFSNLYVRQFAYDFGSIGVMVMSIVMMIGGSSCSTAGGIKGLRIGILFKAIIGEIRRMVSSERKLLVLKFHNISDQIISDKVIKAVSVVTLLYILVFIFGVLLSTYNGYSLTDSIFEMASITGNVGLSIGVTQATMPLSMKIYYIIAMYVGRLEFLSVFALLGVFIQGVLKWYKKIQS